jgi:hypothetical protein
MVTLTLAPIICCETRFLQQLARLVEAQPGDRDRPELGESDRAVPVDHQGIRARRGAEDLHVDEIAGPST